MKDYKKLASEHVEHLRNARMKADSQTLKSEEEHRIYRRVSLKKIEDFMLFNIKSPLTDLAEGFRAKDVPATVTNGQQTDVVLGEDFAIRYLLEVASPEAGIPGASLSFQGDAETYKVVASINGDSFAEFDPIIQSREGFDDAVEKFLEVLQFSDAQK